MSSSMRTGYSISPPTKISRALSRGWQRRKRPRPRTPRRRHEPAEVPGPSLLRRRAPPMPHLARASMASGLVEGQARDAGREGRRAYPDRDRERDRERAARDHGREDRDHSSLEAFQVGQARLPLLVCHPPVRAMGVPARAAAIRSLGRRDWEPGQATCLGKKADRDHRSSLPVLAEEGGQIWAASVQALGMSVGPGTAIPPRCPLRWGAARVSQEQQAAEDRQAAISAQEVRISCVGRGGLPPPVRREMPAPMSQDWDHQER
jgi:hypothetical protein